MGNYSLWRQAKFSPHISRQTLQTITSTKDHLDFHRNWYNHKNVEPPHSLPWRYYQALCHSHPQITAVAFDKLYFFVVANYVLTDRSLHGSA